MKVAKCVPVGMVKWELCASDTPGTMSRAVCAAPAQCSPLLVSSGNRAPQLIVLHGAESSLSIAAPFRARVLSCGCMQFGERGCRLFFSHSFWISLFSSLHSAKIPLPLVWTCFFFPTQKHSFVLFFLGRKKVMILEKNLFTHCLFSAHLSNIFEAEAPPFCLCFLGTECLTNVSLQIAKAYRGHV